MSNNVRNISKVASKHQKWTVAILRTLVPKSIEDTLLVLCVAAVFLFNYSGGYLTILTNALILVFVFYEFCLMIKRNTPIINPISAAMFCFFAICVASLLYSIAPELSIEKVQTMFFLVLFSVSLIGYAISHSDSDSVNRMVRWVIVGAILSAVMILIGSGWTSGGRENVVGDSNTAGAYLSLTLVLVFWRMKTWRTPSMLGVPIMGVLVLAIFASGSRSVFLSALVGLLLLQFFYKKKKGVIDFKKMAGTVIVIGVVAVLIYLSFSNDLLYEILGRRIQSFFEIMAGQQSNVNERSTQVRTEMIAKALALFLEHPLTGIGINGFISVSGINAYAHNDYVELLACVGLLGFSAFYSQYVFLFAKALKCSIELRSVVITMLAQMAISHFFVVFYYSKLEMIFIALLFMLVTQGSRFEKGEKRLRISSPDLS